MGHSWHRRTGRLSLERPKGLSKNFGFLQQDSSCFVPAFGALARVFIDAYTAFPVDSYTYRGNYGG